MQVVNSLAFAIMILVHNLMVEIAYLMTVMVIAEVLLLKTVQVYAEVLLLKTVQVHAKVLLLRTNVVFVMEIINVKVLVVLETLLHVITTQLLLLKYLAY